MQQLLHIIKGIEIIQIVGDRDRTISSLVIDSRKATAQCMFIAWKGTLTDGHQYIAQAVTGGATAVVCEQLPENIDSSVCYIQVKDAQQSAALLAAAFYGHPSAQIKVTGVTGTNGKTTVATVLFKLFRELGYDCGLISTVRNQINETTIPATHTTPDSVSLQALFRQMADAGCSHVFMEVSSHAIHQHRVSGIRFEGGIFTNITHDHLDYHHTFDEYIRVKKQFFDQLPKDAFAITNVDDKRGMVMLQNTAAHRKTYGLRNPADFKGKVLDNALDGLHMNIDKMDVHFRMSGLFNAYNLLAVYGAAQMLGAEKLEVLAALSNIKGAEGRFDTYRSPNERILGIIDYAHTPDALLNVLATIKASSREHQIITVVGCGGDRDRTKRPLMAQVACEHSHKVILTSDNPRSEDPEAILNDMEAELTYSHKRKVLRISDRRTAIKTACSLAQPEDIVLIAGKGHENYQEIKGVRQHFDDREELLDAFQQLEK